MKRFCMALLAVSLVVLAFGCGQSGPLYLPDDPSRIESVSPATTDEDAEDEEKEAGDDSPAS